MEEEEEDVQLPIGRPSQYPYTPSISEQGSGLGPVPGPMVSATLGRVMTALLNAKPKKLQDSISRLHSPPKIAASVTGIHVHCHVFNLTQTNLVK